MINNFFSQDTHKRMNSEGQAFNGLGGGVSFLIARFMVPSTESDSSSEETMTKEIHNYLLFLSIPPVLFFLCVLFYFPSAPPSPPR